MGFELPTHRHESHPITTTSELHPNLEGVGLPFETQNKHYLIVEKAAKRKWVQTPKLKLVYRFIRLWKQFIILAEYRESNFCREVCEPQRTPLEQVSHLKPVTWAT